MPTRPKPSNTGKTSKPKSAKRTAAKEPVATAPVRGRKAASVAGKVVPAGPRARAKQAATSRAPLYYRLHALLHTVQVIGRFEDQLAGLLHEAGRVGTLDEDAREELHNLLLDMPSSSYHAELDALHEALHTLKEHQAA